MLNEADRFKYIKDAMLALEMEISVIESDLTLDKMHLFNLRKLKRDLEFNLSILKERKVVVVAQQYKEIISELKTIDKKIKHYEQSIDTLTKRKHNKKQAKQLYRQNYETLKHVLDNKKVILRFDLDKKKAKDNAE